MRRSKHPVLWILSLLGFLVFAVMTGQELTADEQVSLTREDAGRLAADFLKTKGVSTSGYLRTELYQGDTEIDAYLKRHGLHEEFEKNSKTARPLTYWEVTYFLPDGDSYRVRMNETTGQVLGYEIRQQVDPAAPVLAEKEALRLAREELSRQGVQLAQLVPAKLTEREKQEWEDEHKYKWRDTAWKVGESQYIYKVGISGKQVTTYKTVYLIPEVDQNWFDKQRTLGFIMTGISLLGMLVLVIFSFVVTFVYPRHEVDWQRGLVLGLVLLGIALVSNLNEWPIFLTNLLFTDMPIDLMLWGTALSVTALALLSSGSTYITAVAGGVLQHEIWPGKWLRWGSSHWPERVRSAAYRGYLVAFFWLGLQGIFYWVSETYLGVWQENDFTLTPWNYLVPGLFPLLAWTAGIGEEITFRLLGMSLVKKYLRSTFLALLLPAMVWALAHSLYPVHPFYTRFIELTLFGMMIGWFFLRYDLETVIFAHVIFDTVLMSIPLLFEGTLTDQLWAVGWLILPALAGRYSHLLQRST